MDLTGAGPAAQPSLLERVEQYLKANNIPASRFGMLAVRSPSLVARMRSGAGLHNNTVARIEALLRAMPAISATRQRGKTFRFTTMGQFKAARYAKTVHERDVAERQEIARRQEDPAEQAALFLRRRGWMVCRARVFDENATGWAAGRQRLEDDDALIALARQRGWGE